jgi:two-component system, NtrC family, response regulator HydG
LDMRSVLLMDADMDATGLLSGLMGGNSVEQVTSISQMFDRLTAFAWDAIIFDPYLRDDSLRAQAKERSADDAALELLRRIRTQAPDTVALPWCVQPTVIFAVRAMRGGALDVLRKDMDSAELQRTIERAMAHGALAREVKRLRGEVERARGLGDLVGDSPLMRQLQGVVERVAASDATVLIVGESGTGKELLARTIHRVGPRSEGPFVAFDCSALAPSLLEDELFGHEKGAFTGASRARRGLFREAQGGTIFLDEIGDIDSSVQNKLLRVLQEREIKPVGSERTVPIDVRVVAATNKDLRQLIARGLFREDLFWRLAVVPVMVPPLRERRDDIPKLAAHILARRRGAAKSFAGNEARYPTQITGRALARLTSYHWPGNIRELENVLSRAAILCDGEIIRDDDLDLVGVESMGSAAVKADGHSAMIGGSLKEQVSHAVRQVEMAAIRHALAQHDSVGQAATSLGVSRAGLYNKMKEYAIVFGNESISSKSNRESD